MKIFNNTTTIDMDSEQKYFTRHGLHMNNSGKENMAKRITEEVKRIVH